MERYTSNSPGETGDIAALILKTHPDVKVIALMGGLGAGKTHFVKGLSKALGYTGEVTSPTFALVHEYRLEYGGIVLAHFDMYRLSSEEDLDVTGFYDYLDRGTLIAAEWSENIERYLPAGSLIVKIEHAGEERREILVETKEEEINKYDTKHRKQC